MTRQTNTKVETKTIVMSLSNLEAAIASFLYATRTIPESWDITYMNLEIPADKNGLVEFDVEVTRPVASNLKLVDDSYNQTELPFQTFEKIHVKNS